MGWISSLFKGSEVDRARSAAEASKERTDDEARDFDRWLAALGAKDEATKAAAHAHLRNAAAAAEKGDLGGWQEAREQFELARAAFCRGRAALALAQPRDAAFLLLEDAAEDTAEIGDVEERSASATKIAELQAWGGDLGGARRTLETITEPVDRASVERGIAIARAAAETLDPARFARELADSDSDLWSHEEILLSIVEDQCRRGNVERAQGMLEQIEDPSLMSVAQRFLASAESRRGRLAEARTIAEGIERPDVSAAAWSDFALAQATSGDVEGALKTVEGLQDESARATALGAIAGALVEAGNEDRANELLERIADPHARDDALTWIAEAKAKAGDYAGALATIEELENPPLQAQELVTLAESALTAGRQEAADDLFQRALEKADLLQGSSRHPSSWLALFLVDARARLGQFEGAEAVVSVLGEERQRAELLGRLSLYLTRLSGGGLVALEGLLDRHPGLLERISIQQHGAQGLLALAQARTAKSSTAPSSPSAAS
jgi:tetratricopeptide (TPR) repeat protein